jgi:hypothetical protein
VKVLLLESVDPEDRKLRQRKLLDKSRSLYRGHSAALQAGNKQAAEKLFMRSMRAKYIAHRDKNQMDAYRSAMHSDRAPSHVGSLSKGKGVDSEDRKVRLRRILDKANKLRSMASVTKSADPTAASRMIMTARLHTDMANAYKKGGNAKRKWQNVWRDSDRELRLKIKSAGFGAKPPSMTPDQLRDFKAGHIAKNIKFQWRPFIKKGSKVDPVNRSTRLAKIMLKADDIKVAKNHAMAGNTHSANALGVPGKARGLFAGDDKRSLHHGHDLTRAHMIVAKFLKRPGNRAKMNTAIRMLRKGQSIIGVTGMSKLKHPLKQFGVKSENSQ